MTILAQQWLENRRPSKWDFWVEARLGHPGVSPTPSFLKITGHEDQNTYDGLLETQAQRVVFDEHLDEAWISAVESGGLSRDVVLESVRMPCQSLWVEWKAVGTTKNPVHNLRVGVLFDCKGELKHKNIPENPNKDNRIAVIVVAGNEKISEVICFGVIDQLPYEIGSNKHIGLGWSSFAEHGGVKDFETDQEFGQFIMTSLFGVFCMQMPNLTNQKKVEWDEPLQRSRLKKGKHPLLEYVRVDVKLGQPVKRRTLSGSSQNETDADRRRRYHLCMGHWRVYHRGLPNQKVIWIRDHYKGDPSVGVIISEKHVQRKEI